MLGAMIGDVIGSRFEFDRGNKTKEFTLFTKKNYFTDDTVMTIAVAEALMGVGKDAGSETIKKAVVDSMVKWGKRYPNAGYGARFYWWLLEKDPQPYNSFGNGSAMRVSSVGWLYDSLERTLEVAKLTAEVSHSHPEGIKGAQATAGAIYLARTGASKDQIRDFVENTIGYDLSRSCDEIRPGYYHVESCQQSVPEAITAFLEGQDYEDVIRTVISLGGDTDTIAAIAGAIGEAYYGIDVSIIKQAFGYFDEEMLKCVKKFHEIIKWD